jgi:hypothetical protein
MDITMYKLYQNLKENDILMTYCGAFAQESIEGIGNAIRKNLAAEEAETSTALTVFSIFIEQVQNILNYSAEKLIIREDDEHELRFGMAIVGRNPTGKFFVCCGNKVLREDMPVIKEKLEMLNALSREDLKDLYKKQRRNVLPLNGKGAGLGLIEMARKSEGPMEYSFEPAGSDWFFFSIKVTVRR